MKNARKIVKGSPARAMRSTELDFFTGDYRFDADKALARLVVKRLFASEYLKMAVTV